MSMPPLELWLRGPRRDRPGMLGPGIGCRGSRLVPTAANGSPAFGQYRPGPSGGTSRGRSSCWRSGRPDRRAHTLPRHRAAVPAVRAAGPPVTTVPVELLAHLRRARDHSTGTTGRRWTSTSWPRSPGLQVPFRARFESTYGETPIRYLTRRRIERAQDLLRSANLTVTEVCMLVGFSSLGSFSSRFTATGGGEPDRLPGPLGRRGRTARPGLLPVHARVLDSTDAAQFGEAPRQSTGRNIAGMITNISLVTVYCLDQDKARDFYVDMLGFEPRTDVTMGEGFRWVTIEPPQPARAGGDPDGPRPAAGRGGAPSSCDASWRRARWAGSGSGRRLPQDLRGAVREGRHVPAGALRPAVRRGGRHARRHRQLAGARRAPRFTPGDFG